jgi:hypothetical protein
VIALLAILAAVYGLAGGGDDSGGQAGTEACPFAQLEARPLRLPALEVDDQCPQVNAMQLPGVPTEGALGPGKPTKSGLPKLRRGPIYVAPAGAPRFLYFPPSPADTSARDRTPPADTSARDRRWRRADVLWVSKPSYRGPVVVRGGLLDRSRRLRFGAREQLKLRLPGKAWMEQRDPLRVWGRIVHPREGWRMWVSQTRIRNSNTGDPTRCYAYQVDGKGFSYTLAFIAVLEP